MELTPTLPKESLQNRLYNMDNLPRDHKLLHHPSRTWKTNIFENDRFVAVNKPAGMLSIPDRFNETLPSLYKILEKEYQKIFIIHRLDRETTGIILFAKDESTHKYFSQLFENRKIEKFYWG